MRIAAAGAAALAVAGVLTLAACGSDGGPEKVTDVHWQATMIGDASLDAADQTGTWLVLGADSFTGASGCVELTGNVSWSSSDDDSRVTLSDLDTRTDGDCAQGDEYNASQMEDILSTPDLRWTYSDDNSLRTLRLWVDGTPERGISFAG